MSSSLLFQAVELAQEGRREEARQLLWQYLQADPNNEVAWLWLASVAGDQAEYQRALNEVLRIDPNHAQAQQLLAQFRQQFGGQPPASSYAPPSYTPPPPPPSYAAQGAPRPGYASQGIPAAPVMQPVDVQVRAVEKRRGCLGCSLPGCFGCGCGGCGPGCLLGILLVLIAPVVVCGILIASGEDLGPLESFAAYLPGDLGRKTITFDAYEQDTVYEISLKAPRSWFVADPDVQGWDMWRQVLDDTMPFENPDELWTDFEVGPRETPRIVETDIITLAEGGYPVVLELQGIEPGGSYGCAAVRANPDAEGVVEYDNDFCGYRQETVGPAPDVGTLTRSTVPDQLRTIDFFVPLDATSAAHWQLVVPDDVYTRLQDDLEVMIESVEIDEK